jgi:hypothetical protein
MVDYGAALINALGPHKVHVDQRLEVGDEHQRTSQSENFPINH